MNTKAGSLKSSEWRAVLTLWAVLMAVAITALLLLNANSIRIINHIEFDKGGRYQRMGVLYSEAEKHARKAMAQADALNRPSDTKIPLSITDPDYLAALDLYRRAALLDLRDPFVPERAPYYEIAAQLQDAVNETTAEKRLLACSFICAKDFDDATTYTEAIVKADPKDWEAWRILAESRLRAGKPAEAEAAVAKMTGASSRVVHELQGNIAMAKGEFPSAAKELKTALDTDPSDLALRKRLVRALINTDPNQAINVLADGLKGGPVDDGNYYHIFGIVLSDTGRNEEALKMLDRAAALEPYNGGVQWSLAQVYDRMNDSKKSTEAMQQAFRLEPELRGQALRKK